MGVTEFEHNIISRITPGTPVLYDHRPSMGHEPLSINLAGYPDIRDQWATLFFAEFSSIIIKRFEKTFKPKDFDTSIAAIVPRQGKCWNLSLFTPKHIEFLEEHLGKHRANKRHQNCSNNNQVYVSWYDVIDPNHWHIGYDEVIHGLEKMNLTHFLPLLDGVPLQQLRPGDDKTEITLRYTPRIGNECVSSGETVDTQLEVSPNTTIEQVCNRFKIDSIAQVLENHYWKGVVTDYKRTGPIEDGRIYQIFNFEDGQSAGLKRLNDAK